MTYEVKRARLWSRRILLIAVATGSLLLSVALGQQRSAQQRQAPGSGVQGGAQGGVPGGVVGGIAWGVPAGAQARTSEIYKELEQAPETIIQYRNKNNTPLTITEAKLKAVKTEDAYQRKSSKWATLGSQYELKLTLQLVNQTNYPIRGVAIEVEDAEDNTTMYYEQVRPVIEPNATYTLKGRQFSGFFEDLSRMTVRVIGVLFEDWDGWGRVPPPPPPPPPAPAAPPAAPGEIPKVIRKPGGVLAGSALRRVEPTYPPLAKAAQIGGAVVVEITVDEAGEVAAARALSGHPLLRDAAVEAARQWQFQPTALSGTPVKVIGTLTFTFNL